MMLVGGFMRHRHVLSLQTHYSSSRTTREFYCHDDGTRYGTIVTIVTMTVVVALVSEFVLSLPPVPPAYPGA